MVFDFVLALLIVWGLIYVAPILIMALIVGLFKIMDKK